jgi:hypothetical protein
VGSGLFDETATIPLADTEDNELGRLDRADADLDVDLDVVGEHIVPRNPAGQGHTGQLDASAERRLAGFTVGKFLAQNPKGSFLIIVSKHALAIRDGKVYDNINEMDKLFLSSGRDQRKCQAIFQIVPGK